MAFSLRSFLQWPLMAPMMQNLQTRASVIKQRVDAAVERLAQEGNQLKPPGQ